MTIFFDKWSYHFSFTCCFLLGISLTLSKLFLLLATTILICHFCLDFNIGLTKLSWCIYIYLHDCKLRAQFSVVVELTGARFHIILYDCKLSTSLLVENLINKILVHLTAGYLLKSEILVVWPLWIHSTVLFLQINGRPLFTFQISDNSFVINVFKSLWYNFLPTLATIRVIKLIFLRINGRKWQKFRGLIVDLWLFINRGVDQATLPLIWQCTLIILFVTVASHGDCVRPLELF